MRTTVNIRAEALEMVRERARERGLPLGEVVSEAIFTAFGASAPDQPGKKRVTLPVGGGGGLRVGVSLDHSPAVRDRMDGIG